MLETCTPRKAEELRCYTMMKLEILAKNSGVSTRRGEEDIVDFLSRITHLHLQDKKITEITNLNYCGRLSMLYLQNNLITEIPVGCSIQSCRFLTHLHLERNQIDNIEGIGSLVNLTKL